MDEHNNENEQPGNKGGDQKAPERETSGEYLWKRLGAIGCILILVLMVAMIVTCFVAPHMN